MASVKLNPDKFLVEFLANIEQRISRSGSDNMSLSLSDVVITIARKKQLHEHANRRQLNAVVTDWWLSLPKNDGAYDRILFGRRVVLSANGGDGFVSIGKDPHTGHASMDQLKVLEEVDTIEN